MPQDTLETKETTTVSGAPNQAVQTTRRVVQPAPVASEHPQQSYQKKKVIFRTYQIIWYLLGVVEVLLGFRVILRALGANQGSGFTDLIYSLSAPLAQPFSGIFGVTAEGGYVIEWTTFVAMAVYALLAYGLVMLFQLVKPTTPEEVEQTVNNP